MARFEIFFAGLVSFITKDGTNRVTADFVDADEHEVRLWESQNKKTYPINDQMTLSLSPGDVRPRVKLLKQHVPSLREHTFSNQGDPVRLFADNQRPIRSRLELPTGRLTVAQLYYYDGVFERNRAKSAPQRIARITALVADDSQDGISIKVAGSEILKINPKYFIVITNYPPPNDQHQHGQNHFSFFRPFTDADDIDILEEDDSTARANLSRIKGARKKTARARAARTLNGDPLDPAPPAHTVAAIKYIDDTFGSETDPLTIATQIDCSSSQWP